MNLLSLTRCRNHPDREAAARCPRCRRFYCRECVTEHQGQLICADCLREAGESRAPRRGRRSPLPGLLGLAGGILLAWAFFLLAGRILLSIPTSFHEGTVWQAMAED